MRSLSQINADIKEVEAEISSQRCTLISLQLLELAGGESSKVSILTQQSAIKLVKTKLSELHTRSKELLKEREKLLTEPLPPLLPPASTSVSTESVSATALVRFQHTGSSLSTSSSSSSSSIGYSHGK